MLPFSMPGLHSTAFLAETSYLLQDSVFMKTHLLFCSLYLNINLLPILQNS